MTTDATSRWPAGPGVIELPDGTQVRGRGLRRPAPAGPDPELGLYLAAERPPATPWPATWIRWPDFRVPARADRADAMRTIAELHALAATNRVEVACWGGRGRTGTVLACMATMAGLQPRDAIAFVRCAYDRHAVETPFQRRFVAAFARR